MWKPHDFEYALEHTRVVRHPRQLIQTFGATSFRFLLVSELMDEIDRVRVRDGSIQAERPRIVSPHVYRRLLLDGFGEEAREYADWLESNKTVARILQYGFQFRKLDVSEEIVRSSKEEVLGRLEERVESGSDTDAAIIEGIDDTWEICLLKFTVDLIQRSASENVDEWRRRGLI